MKSEKLQFKIKSVINPSLIILIAVVLRLIPHPANVAPITAMALFGGVYLNKKYAFIIPLVAMVISDIFLGFSPSTPYVYVSFLLSGVIGLWLKKRKTVLTIFLASLGSSILFFLITNFGFWLTDDIYPKTFAGQLEAYFYALPFFRNTILGDLLYTGLFFGSYELVLRLINSKYKILNFKQ